MAGKTEFKPLNGFWKFRNKNTFRNMAIAANKAVTSPNSTNGFTYRSTDFWQLVSIILFCHTVNSHIHSLYGNFMMTFLTHRKLVLIQSTEMHSISVKFLANFDIKAKTCAIQNRFVELPTHLCIKFKRHCCKVKFDRFSPTERI